MKQLIILTSIFFFIACKTKHQSDIECHRIMERMQYGEEEDIVTLELVFMGYACGDCIPNYTISKVIFSENDNYDYYFNKEIHLEFENNHLKQEIENQVNKLSHKKYKLIMTGKFKRNGFGVGKLEASKGEINTE